MPTPIAVDHLVAGVLEDVAAREARVSFKEVKARSRDMDPCLLYTSDAADDAPRV